MMMLAERLFCDTNILLNAVDRKRALHAEALRVLNALPNQGIELCVSGQIIREFLAVCTRPTDANGLGQTSRLAVGNAEAIAARSTVLEETRGVARRLLRIARTSKCTGRQLHDANIVATMQEHGLTHLVTENGSDFRRFDGVNLVNLASIDEHGG